LECPAGGEQVGYTQMDAHLKRWHPEYWVNMRALIALHLEDTPPHPSRQERRRKERERERERRTIDRALHGQKVHGEE
jgi:hypothetical protein